MGQQVTQRCGQCKKSVPIAEFKSDKHLMRCLVCQTKPPAPPKVKKAKNTKRKRPKLQVRSVVSGGLPGLGKGR